MLFVYSFVWLMRHIFSDFVNDMFIKKKVCDSDGPLSINGKLTRFEALGAHCCEPLPALFHTYGTIVCIS